MRDKCRLIPYVSGAEFLQSPSGLTCSRSFLHRYQLQLIKDATLYFGRQFVLIEQDVWKHSPSEGTSCLGQHDKWNLCVITATQPQDTLARRASVADPQARWWRLLHVCFACYPTLPLLKLDNRKSHNMAACLQAAKEHNTANMGHLLCDEQLKARRKLFIWLEAKPNCSHQWSSSPPQKKPNKKRGMFPYQKNFTGWKTWRIKEPSKQNEDKRGDRPVSLLRASW